MGYFEIELNNSNYLKPTKESSISEKHLEILLEEFSESGDIKSNLRDCFIIGFGSQTESIFTEIGRMEGVSVIWTDFIFSGWKRIFSIFLAGRMGIVEINDKSKIPEIIKILSSRGMAGLYSFNKEMRDEFIKTIIKHKSFPEIVLQRDQSFLSFIVDGDNPHSDTGMTVSTYYGKKCPRDLIRISEKI